MELIPGLHVIAKRYMICGIVDKNIYRTVRHIRHHPLTPYEWRSLQLYATRDAVPVALGLVCHRVGILTHADILDAVIDTDSDIVVASRLHECSNIILVRSRQAHLMAHLATVDKHRRLNVGAFQIEHNALCLAP